MAAELEKLVVSLEASITKYERAMAKAAGVADSRAKQIEKRFDGMNTKLGRSFQTLSQVGARAFGLLGVALGGRAILEMTSQFTDLKSQIDAAAGSVEAGADVLDRLQDVARRTYSPLQQTADSYLRNAIVLKELGYSTQQQLDLTETLNNALVVSATRGDRARSVMEAWSKAMADGKLSGDNLNTIIQSGGRLSKALADSMGVTTTELRKLGAEGKITTDVMIGVTKQLDTLRAEAEAMPATVSDGFTLLGNAVLRFVGEADKAVGSSAALAEAIIAVADALDEVRESDWFADLLKAIGDDLGKTIASTRREVDALALAIDYLQKNGARDVVSDMLGGEPAAVANGLRNIADAVTAIAGSDAGAVFQELTEKLIANSISARDAKAEIAAFGEANPNLGPMAAQFAALIEQLRVVRAEAIAAATGLSAIPGGPSRGRGGGRALALAEEANRLPARPTGPARGRGGGRALALAVDAAEREDRAKSRLAAADAAERQAEAVRALISDLQFEQSILSESAEEQDILNTLRRAGVDATSKQGQEIRGLIEAINAEKVARDAINETLEEQAKLAESAGRAIADALRDGKVEGQELLGILVDVAKQMALASLTKLNEAGGGNILTSVLSGILGGFASGTPNTGGARGQVRGLVHGQEAVIPLPSGGKVPVDIRLPSIGGAPQKVVNNVFNYGSEKVEQRQNSTGGVDTIIGAVEQRIKTNMAQGKYRQFGVNPGIVRR